MNIATGDADARLVLGRPRPAETKGTRASAGTTSSRRMGPARRHLLRSLSAPEGAVQLLVRGRGSRLLPLKGRDRFFSAEKARARQGNWAKGRRPTSSASDAKLSRTKKFVAKRRRKDIVEEEKEKTRGRRAGAGRPKFSRHGSGFRTFPSGPRRASADRTGPVKTAPAEAAAYRAIHQKAGRWSYLQRSISAAMISR